jgi:hypothetical protein
MGGMFYGAKEPLDIHMILSKKRRERERDRERERRETSRKKKR